MFDHVTIRVSDMPASLRLYTAVLHELGMEPDLIGEDMPEWEDFSMGRADGEHPPTRNLHIGFGAPSREVVDRFWEAGRRAGGSDDGEPGPRPQYGDDYYGGFLRDPDGNSIEAVHHDEVRPAGFIDHIWVRVSD